ncbi:hypothetical protein JCM17960_01660 [Magnetospira thiophila]
MTRLILSVILLSASILFYRGRGDFIANLPFDLSFDAEMMTNLGQTLIWLATAFVTSSSLALLISRWTRQHGKDGLPRLYGTLLSLFIWGFALIGIVTVVLGSDMSDLVTASSVLVAVLGFSLRGMISDLFYGLAMAMEKPFESGDWVQVADLTIGQVVDMNWRSTRLLTRDDVSVVIPHGILATSQFRNLNRPHSYWRDSLRIHLGYDITSHQGERLLLSAVEQVPASANIPEKAEARIVDFDERGVIWELRFWVSDYAAKSSTNYAVRRALLRNLHFAGIAVPRERSEIFIEQLSRRIDQETDHIERWLTRVDLFATLPRESQDALMEKTERRLYLHGEPVVRQGEDGSSMFILNEGLLHVLIADEEGTQQRVGMLRPGDFFGEMSLLTGAPRAATVVPAVDSFVHEITKQDIDPFVQAHPQILEHMSHQVTERQLANSKALESATSTQIEEHRTGVLKRIRQFFQVG